MRPPNQLVSVAVTTRTYTEQETTSQRPQRTVPHEHKARYGSVKKPRHGCRLLRHRKVFVQRLSGPSNEMVAGLNPVFGSNVFRSTLPLQYKSWSGR